MQSNNYFLTLTHVSKTTKKDKRTIILDDINFTLPKEGLYFLSCEDKKEELTLFSIIGGLNKPSSGEVLFCGQSIYKQKNSYLEAYRNKITSLVLQDNLIDDMSVSDNLSLVFQLNDRKPDIQEIKNTLNYLNVDDIDSFLLKKASTLSEDEKIKISIASALIKKSKIILCEYTSSSFVEKTENELLGILKKISKNTLIIVASNDSELIENYSLGKIRLSNHTCDNLSFEKETEEPSSFDVLTSKHLSLLASFKLAMKFLFKRKVMLSLALFMTFLSLFASGLSIISLRANPNDGIINALYDEGFKDVILRSKMTDWSNYEMQWPVLQEKQIEILKDFTKQEDLIYVYEGTSLQSNSSHSFYSIFNFKENNPSIDSGEQKNAYDKNFKKSPNGIIEMNETDLDYTEFILDSRLKNKDSCHFPSDYDEIALTSFKANFYLENGYKDEKGNILKFDSIDDLIGKKLSSYTVSAIYETREDIDFAKKHSFTGNISKSQEEENKAYLNGTYINNFMILKKGTIKHLCEENDVLFQNHISVFVRLPERKSKFSSLIKKLTYIDSKKYYHRYSVHILSPVSPLAKRVDNEKFSIWHCVFLIVSAILVLLDILLLSNLIFSSFKKKTLSVLMSSGIRKKDIIAICLLEAISINLVCFLLSAPLIVGICTNVNKFAFCNYFLYGTENILWMLLSIVMISILSSLKTFGELFSKQPYHFIKE